MTIIQAGSTNLTALVVPDIDVQIIPPNIAYLNGVPSNIAGFVGGASWGPKNAPVTVSDYASYKQAFGELMNRTFDMGTHVACAVIQGAGNFRCVRVTDTTDVAATGTLTVGASPTPAVLFTGFYTGIRGNLIVVTFGAGSAPNSYRVAISVPGLVPELFDNIVGTGAALWQAVVSAVNNGTGLARGPSKLVIASLVSSPTVAPVAGAVTTVALSGGTDGTGTLTTAMIVGVDGTPRTGMYALRATGCAVMDLVDMTDLTQVSAVTAFCLSESIYGIGAAAAGECSGGGGTGTVQTDSNTTATDSFSYKMLAGDWLLWNDNVLGLQRYVSPAAFVAGMLANQSPQNAGLNLPLFGIAGSQTSQVGKTYSDAELGVIEAARFDVVAFPSVGGQYWSCRLGVNMSSNPTIHQDNYPRLTYYIARTFNAALGKWVGKLQTPQQRLDAKSQATSFFQAMQDAGQIGNADGTVPFNVILDSTINPASQVALGYEVADAFVQYLSVIEHFILNLQGGQSVQIVGQASQQTAAS